MHDDPILPLPSSDNSEQNSNIEIQSHETFFNHKQYYLNSS